jgi:hypothetical protein
MACAGTEADLRLCVSSSSDDGIFPLSSPGQPLRKTAFLHKSIEVIKTYSCHMFANITEMEAAFSPLLLECYSNVL